MAGATAHATGVYEIPLEPGHDALASAPMFSRLAPASLRHLIGAVELVELDAGEMLYHQGDAPDSVYVVIDGHLALTAAGPRATAVAEVGPGGVLGVVGLYAGERRPLAAIARSPSRLLEISRSAIEALATDVPELGEALLELARDRLLSTLLATHPLFVRFRASSAGLARRFRLFEVIVGGHLVPVGAPPGHLFVIMTGRLEVTGPDGDVVAQLGSGSLVAESEFLSRAPVAMPIIARQRARVLGLPYADFLALAAEYPTFLDGVVREASAPVWDPALIS